MHQQTYCHTLLQPFFKIFLLRIYAPTIHSTDIEFDETSVRHPQIHAPIQPTQTNPPTTQSTHHRYHHTHSTNTTTIQPPQTHTASTPTQTHSTQGRPDIDAVDALDVDADAQTFSPPQAGLQSGLQAGHVDAAPCQSAIRQARYRIRPHKNRQYQATAAIGQAISDWTDQAVLDQN